MNLMRLARGGLLVGLAAGCGDGPVAPYPTSPDGLLIAFDGVWTRYDADYAYFVYKSINWDSLRNVYRPRAAAATSEVELAEVVREMLGNLRDVHAWLTDPVGRQIATYTPARFVNWRQSLWQTYMARFTPHPQPNDWGYAMLGAVPYLYFGAWSSGALSATAVDAVLETLKSAPAIVARDAARDRRR